MKRHAPWEIADFFGCYVAQDKEGSWFLYNEKPIQWAVYGSWSTEGPNVDITALVDEPIGHIWTHLYKPHSDNKDTANYSKQGNSDNKDSANSSENSKNEQKEYCILGHALSRELSRQVNEAMKDGWKPYGGVAVEHLPKSDGYETDSQYFYQAMVRGL